MNYTINGIFAKKNNRAKRTEVEVVALREEIEFKSQYVNAAIGVELWVAEEYEVTTVGLY